MKMKTSLEEVNYQALVTLAQTLNKNFMRRGKFSLEASKLEFLRLENSKS